MKPGDDMTRRSTRCLAGRHRTERCADIAICRVDYDVWWRATRSGRTRSPGEQASAREFSLPSAHVSNVPTFYASRGLREFLSRAGRDFADQPSPAQTELIGKTEESIHIAHIASIKIVTHLLFSEWRSNQAAAKPRGWRTATPKGDAIAMKELIDELPNGLLQNQPVTI